MPKTSEIKAPHDISCLLRGNPEGLDTGKYYRGFGTSQYAYLEGFNEFWTACVLEGGFLDEGHAIAVIRASTADAVAMAPKEWKTQFPAGRWNVCHPDQVSQARDFEPMCLEKGLLVIYATAIACRRSAYPSLHRLNPFEFITIHPAIYKLTGLEKWAVLHNQFPRRMTSSEKTLVAQLKQRLQDAAPRSKVHATQARAGDLLKLAFEGRSMTWKNAELLRSTISEAIFSAKEKSNDIPGEDCLLGAIDVAVMNGRNDGGRFAGKKRVNDQEGPFVTLSKETSVALRAAVKKSQDAFILLQG